MHILLCSHCSTCIFFPAAVDYSKKIQYTETRFSAAVTGRYEMTDKQLQNKLQDCISFYKKQTYGTDQKEFFFSRLEFLDHQKTFESNVLYIGTLQRFQSLYSSKLITSETLFLLAETTAAQLEQISLCPRTSIMISPLPQERLFNRISTQYTASPVSPDDIWKQILERKLIGADDIVNALFPDARSQGFYVQLLLFHPEHGQSSELLFALHALFPLDPVVQQNKNVIVLRRYDSQLFHFPLPAGIDSWLAEHDALLCVGNATRDLSMLRTNAALLAQMCRLALHLRRPQQKILLLEEYQLFILIDNSVKEFIRKNGHSDICYLAHPAVIHIARYDELHHSNLLEVLYQYLIYGGNIQKTADFLYMHRNTVLNKLKKIQKLIQLDLSDGLLCQRLLLSCQLVEYQGKVLKQPLNLERNYDE